MTHETVDSKPGALESKKWYQALNILLSIFLFLLPWQTRFVYDKQFVSGIFWEYGSMSVYATEIVLWVILLVFARITFLNTDWRKVYFAKEVLQNSRRLRLAIISSLVILASVCLFSSNVGLSWYFVFHLLEAVALAAIIATPIVDTVTMYTAFWLGGVGQALFAFFEFLTQWTPVVKGFGLAAHDATVRGTSVVEYADERWLRPYGAFGSPNMLGGFLVLTLLIGIILCIKQKKWSTWLYAGQLLLFAALVIVFSRAAWLGAIVGFVMLTVHYYKNNEARKRLNRQLISFGVIVLCFFLLLPGLFLVRSMATGRLEIRSITEREAQYPIAARLFLSHPIFGTGPGTYSAAVRAATRTTAESAWQPIHNTFVLALVEFGLLGFAMLVFVWQWFVRRARRVNPAFVSVVAALGVMACFDHFWWSMFTGLILVWVVLGLAVKDDREVLKK